MDVIISDTGADVVEGAAAETPTLKPEPEQQRVPNPGATDRNLYYE